MLPCRHEGVGRQAWSGRGWVSPWRRRCAPPPPGRRWARPSRRLIQARRWGEWALALFERICIAALLRHEPPDAVAAEELAGSPRIPPEHLRANTAARETAGWRVRGRSASFTLMLLEPGTQCAVYAEGVDPAAFLDAAEQPMLRWDALPGWLRQPRHSASPRPFGMLSFRRSRYRPDQSSRAPMAHIVASAADRRDGRLNTAVISTGIDTAPSP
ncbi:hypothetical protein KPL78_24210 [Roseomonas sp. HJA6]|uniref:Uncharacterized protein n=1 Tax=Roseomonas alba TaxID=2846776 RepID=A0ABS7AI44_9PROT|nr:hypothetical protein [Neoroseomonas alba]MBW6400985.1 hypothetical protein [Neoroseomonas alba]